MPIKYLDMFAGIGGFRSGLDRLGGFECVGSCEIDIYAKQAYDAIYPTEGELYFADARTIDPFLLQNTLTLFMLIPSSAAICVFYPFVNRS